jgi:hypothetical protein
MCSNISASVDGQVLTSRKTYVVSRCLRISPPPLYLALGRADVTPPIVPTSCLRGVVGSTSLDSREIFRVQSSRPAAYPHPTRTRQEVPTSTPDFELISHAANPVVLVGQPAQPLATRPRRRPQRPAPAPALRTRHASSAPKPLRPASIGYLLLRSAREQGDSFWTDLHTRSIRELPDFILIFKSSDAGHLQTPPGTLQRRRHPRVSLLSTKFYVSAVDPRGSGLLFFMFIRPQPHTCLGTEWLTQGGVVYYFSCL